MVDVAPEPTFPSRRIVHGDALVWLAAHRAPANASVITSLPDISELPALDLTAYRGFFDAVVRALIAWLPPMQVAIFFQSDVCLDGVWLDKGYLVMRAAEAVGARLLWHKIVCREPPGSIARGRAGYSHLLCVSRALSAAPLRTLPDVLAQPGFKPWSKAMGVAACLLACQFLRAETDATLVVDPFCGHGTALAVANALGFDALGIDSSMRQCRAARRLRIGPTQLAGEGTPTAGG